MTTRPFVYLASASPRRRDLLEQMRIACTVLTPDADEDVEGLEARIDDESPRIYVERVARLKSRAALRRIERRRLMPAPVVTGDTTVALGQDILGKPADAHEARVMLRRLSGRTHRVLTAVVVADASRSETAVCDSRVRFRVLTEADIDRYVSTGEPFGKAGAYAIQGLAAAFVARIAGSPSGIVGLPLFETMQLLRTFGIASH